MCNIVVHLKPFIDVFIKVEKRELITKSSSKLHTYLIRIHLQNNALDLNPFKLEPHLPLLITHIIVLNSFSLDELDEVAEDRCAHRRTEELGLTSLAIFIEFEYLFLRLFKNELSHFFTLVVASSDADPPLLVLFGSFFSTLLLLLFDLLVDFLLPL